MNTEGTAHKQITMSCAEETGICSGHSVQLYRADEHLMLNLSRWVEPALKAGGAVILLATESHRQGVVERLQTAGIDVRRASLQGRYLEFDARETLAKFMRSGWPDAERFRSVAFDILERAQAAAKPNSPGVYAFGEMVALLCGEGKVEAAIRLEQLWNEVGRIRGFQLLCAYPVSQFAGQGDGERFLRLCAEHSHVIPADAHRNRESVSQTCRILSVSANTRLLIMRNDTLAVAGYSVVSPKEPEEAAFLLATQRFDVIVIGDSVRQKKRTALISALRSIRDDVPIIFVHAGPNPCIEPLADMSIDVRNGPMALISALQRRDTVRLIA
jgi:hypothetical protein